MKKKTIGFLTAVGLLALTLLTVGCEKAPEAAAGPTTTPPAAAEPTQGEQLPVTPEPTAPPVTAPEDEPYIEPPTEPPVQVDMPQYTLTYSGEMKEHIQTRPVEGENALEFLVTLSDGEYTIFTLQLYQTSGELVAMVENAAGEKIPVSFAMTAVPEGLSPEDEFLFCTAQEQVNAIIASLVLK